MSTLARTDHAQYDALRPLAYLRGAWSSITSRQVAAVGFASVLMTAVDGSYWVDRLDKPGVGSVVVFDALGSLLLFSLTLLAWVAVTHDQSITPRARLTRLVLAVVASGIVTAFATVSMAHAYGLHEVIWNLLEKKQSMPPAWMIVSSSAVQLSLFAGLFVATGEMLQRRRATQLALHAAQREQAEVARGVLESRLAAMQAQVEPQFLFDTLVDIEAQYRRDAVRASDDLDRLITYLRVALPRLRESGSYVEAEIGLVQAYLEVVRSLRGGRPELTVNLAEDCRCARFYPMLLLPLVQRAVRQPAERLPASMRIDVQRAGDKVEIVLIVAQSAGCVEDAELARVRERVVGLYGARATFECSELTDGTTTFKLLIPDEPVCDQ